MKKEKLTNEKKVKIVYNQRGEVNRIKVIEDLFKIKQKDSISKVMKKSVIKYIGEYTYIIESGQKVYFGKDFPNEFVFSKYSQNIPLKLKLAKGRAISGIKEMIENATDRKYSNEKKNKHIKDAKYGFYRYKTIFSFEYNGKEQIYSGSLLIRNDEDGKKYLYDILNIKKNR